MFYNSKRKHKHGMLSATDFEIRQQKLNEAGVQKTSGASVNAALCCSSRLANQSHHVLGV